MAKQQENQSTASGEKLFTVETLRGRFGTPISVYYGIVTMKGWRAGKQVTEDEYTNPFAHIRVRTSINL